MNITVITPYDSSNYGAYLQAYCLKRKLEELGHSVSHIPTRSEDYVRALYYKEKPTRKKEKLFPLRFKKNQEFGKRKYAQFCKDQEEFRVVSEDSDNADLYILGSDEIWNITHPAFRKPVFWGIGRDPVISYAASIGGANTELLKKSPEQINALRKLSDLLVRDGKTVDFVQEVTGRKAQIVCDPTMLVPVEGYGREFHDDYLSQNDCLLIYTYATLSEDSIAAIKAYAKKNRMKLVGCCFNHSWCDHICECSPLEFSSLIRQCKATVTATFHGSIFCILNHANFASISYSPKTTQLLEQFGIPERCLDINGVTEAGLTKILSGGIDYDKVDKKIAAIRKDSVSLLTQAIEKAVGSKSFDYQICPSDSCSGCFACLNKCPEDAVGVTVDLYGRTLPMIDPEKCIRCGMCRKVCPQNTPVELRAPIKCYAAVRKDEAAHKESASGGIGAALAESIIAGGGVVYGATLETGEELVVKHIKAETAEDTEKLRDSKYAQSSIGDIYRGVSSELKAGKKVLFTGTPCQIGGLKNYLGKDHDNLFCVDLICHGIPPVKMFNEHMKTVVGGKEITKISFRLGRRDYCMNVFSGDESIYYIFRDQDTYYRAFFTSLNIRENCYRCQYAADRRCSDITLGDFWGLDKSALSTPMNGKVSVVTVNTEKGQSLIDSIRDVTLLEERDYEEAKPQNDQLNHPSKRHKDRDRFLEEYRKTQDFEKAINATCVPREIADYNFTYGTLPGKAINKIKRIKESGKRK